MDFLIRLLAFCESANLPSEKGELRISRQSTRLPILSEKTFQSTLSFVPEPSQPTLSFVPEPSQSTRLSSQSTRLPSQSTLSIVSEPSEVSDKESRAEFELERVFNLKRELMRVNVTIEEIEEKMGDYTKNNQNAIREIVCEPEIKWKQELELQIERKRCELLQVLNANDGNYCTILHIIEF